MYNLALLTLLSPKKQVRLQADVAGLQSECNFRGRWCLPGLKKQSRWTLENLKLFLVILSGEVTACVSGQFFVSDTDWKWNYLATTLIT